jgi:phage baseplate assembly protein V
MSRILNALAKAVARLVTDTGPRQTMQVEVTKGETIDDIERMQEYGFTSVPPVTGTDCLVAFLGGNREQGIIIVAENRGFRLKGLESGEVAIFDDLGNVVKLGRDALSITGVSKIIAEAPEIEASATIKITATAPAIELVGAVTITGPLTVNGNVATTGTLTNNTKDVGSTHYHVGSPNTAVPV